MLVSMDLGQLEHPGVLGSEEGYRGINRLGTTMATWGIGEQGGECRYQQILDDRTILGYQGARRGM